MNVRIRGLVRLPRDELGGLIGEAVWFYVGRFHPNTRGTGRGRRLSVQPGGVGGLKSKAVNRIPKATPARAWGAPSAREGEGRARGGGGRQVGEGTRGGAELLGPGGPAACAHLPGIWSAPPSSPPSPASPEATTTAPVAGPRVSRAHSKWSPGRRGRGSSRTQSPPLTLEGAAGPRQAQAQAGWGCSGCAPCRGALSLLVPRKLGVSVPGPGARTLP